MKKAGAKSKGKDLFESSGKKDKDELAMMGDDDNLEMELDEKPKKSKKSKKSKETRPPMEENNIQT